MLLAGKVAIVTGGAKGIGKAICEAFVCAGAKVVIADIDEEVAQTTATELRQSGGEVFVVKADVADLSNHSKLVDDVISHFGQINILINNAGIQEKKTDILSLTPEIWDRTMNINLRGMFFLSQAVIPVMIKLGGGNIVNVASIGGQVFWPEIITYSVSKGAVRSLTGVMALALADKNIRVNAIAPGHIDTELNVEALSDPGRREEIAQSTPIRRWGTGKDLAGAVIFLASDQASYVTGHVLVVDGGWTLT